MSACSLFFQYLADLFQHLIDRNQFCRRHLLYSKISIVDNLNIKKSAKFKKLSRKFLFYAR